MMPATLLLIGYSRVGLDGAGGVKRLHDRPLDGLGDNDRRGHESQNQEHRRNNDHRTRRGEDPLDRDLPAGVSWPERL